MLNNEELHAFFEKVDHLSSGERAMLKRNNALLKTSDYGVMLTFLKCFPDGISEEEYKSEALFFAASMRCKLGHSDSIEPCEAVANVLSRMGTGDTRFSDLVHQSAESGRVYPIMRRYLSMYKGPIDTKALYRDLLLWDIERTVDLQNHTFELSVKDRWCTAYAAQ